MKKILFLITLINTTLFSQNNLDNLLNKWNRKNVPYISVQTLSLPNTKAILLDARETYEYNVSHIKDAIHVGYNNFKLSEITKKLPDNKDDKIVVYCSLGIRSETIALKLIKEGYTNVYNLYGGIFEWKNANYKVQDTLGNNTEKIHTFNKRWSKWLLKGEKVYD